MTDPAGSPKLEGGKTDYITTYTEACMKRFFVSILALALVLSLAGSALGAADLSVLKSRDRFYYTDEDNGEWIYFASGPAKSTAGDSVEIRLVSWGKGNALDGDDPEFRFFVTDTEGKDLNTENVFLVIGTEAYELEFKPLSIANVTGSFVPLSGDNEKLIRAFASAESAVAVLHCGDRQLNCVWTKDDLGSVREYCTDLLEMGLIGGGSGVKQGSDDKTAASKIEEILKMRNWYFYEPGNFRFVIPDGWEETNLSQERTYLKAKFVPEKADGTIITMSFYDLWGSYSEEKKARYEKSGLTRENSDISIMTEKDVAEALKTTEDNVRRETFGGCQFFVAVSHDPIDVVMVYGVRNGYNISFQFSGTEDSPHYPAFREMVESLEFLD